MDITGLGPQIGAQIAGATINQAQFQTQQTNAVNMFNAEQEFNAEVSNANLLFEQWSIQQNRELANFLLQNQNRNSAIESIVTLASSQRLAGKFA